MIIIKTINKIFNFLRSAFGELKFVTFPTRAETLKLGSIVLGVSAIFGLSLYLIDWLFQVLRNLLTSVNI